MGSTKRLAPVGKGAGVFKKPRPRAKRVVLPDSPAKQARARAALTEAQINEAVRFYEKGSTVRALALSFGVAYGTMHRRLVEAGVAMRGRGTRP